MLEMLNLVPSWFGGKLAHAGGSWNGPIRQGRRVRLLPALELELSPSLVDGTGRFGSRGRRTHAELDQRPGMPDAVRALVEKSP